MKYKTLVPIYGNVIKVNTGLRRRIGCLVMILILSGINYTFSQVEKTDKAEEKQPKYFDLHFTSIKGESKLLNFANFYFETGDYLKALPLYVKLDQSYPGRIEFLYKIGICYLYKSDERQKSIEYLDRVMKIDPNTKGLKFYLGKANHLNYHFDKAIQYFNSAIQNEGLSSSDKDLVKQLIENCENGKKLVKNELNVLIENIGSPVNTESSEFFPILSADGSVLIFTYKGEKCTGGLQEEYGQSQYFYDVFMSKRSGDKWSEPQGISENINTRGHDASVSLSTDGKKLFIYKYTEKASGDIYISELDNNVWSAPVGLMGDVNSRYWEGSVSLSADGKTMYFSSERPGGFGNTDIYKSTLKSDGTWGQAVNLGPVVNTKYNDEAPFIHADGKTLYFSSQGHNGMGGYDIFYSTFGDDGKWSVPVNIGYPINTTDNDKYYVVLGDKKKAYYSSAQPGGYGQQDIYVVYLDRPAKKKKKKREAKDVKTTATVAIKEKPADKKPPLGSAMSRLTITGEVQYSGKPVTDIKIRIAGEDKSEVGHAITGKDGKFTLLDLPFNRDYIISLSTGRDATVAGVVPSGEKTKSDKLPAVKKTKTGTMESKAKSTGSTTITGSKSPTNISEGGITAARAVMCRSVENLEPVGEGEEFTSDAGRLYLFSDIKLDPGVETTIYHVWYYGDNEMGKVKLQVKGPRWRTYSYKTIISTLKGEWRVDVATDDNKVISSVSFRIK